MQHRSLSLGTSLHWEHIYPLPRFHAFFCALPLPPSVICPWSLTSALSSMPRLCNCFSSPYSVTHIIPIPFKPRLPLKKVFPWLYCPYFSPNVHLRPLTLFLDSSREKRRSLYFPFSHPTWPLPSNSPSSPSLHNSAPLEGRQGKRRTLDIFHAHLGEGATQGAGG